MKTGTHLALQVPGTWNELSPRQLIIATRLLASLSHDPVKLRVRAVLAFNGLKNQLKPTVGGICFLQRGRTSYPIPVDILQQAADRLTFLTSESTLTRQLLPRIAGMLGPDSGLANLTFLEFEESEKHFTDYSLNQRPESLNALLATLYRKIDKSAKPDSPDFSGDQRTKFNPFIVPRNAKNFVRVDAAIKLAVYLFYAGCRNNLVRTFPRVFGDPESRAIGAPVSPDPLRFINFVNAMNLDDITKNEAIRYTSLYEIFIFIQKKSEEAYKLRQPHV